MSFYRDMLARSASGRPAIPICREDRFYPARRTWTGSITLFCASLLSAGLVLGGCDRSGSDFGFTARSVTLQPGYQQVLASLQQELVLSTNAVEALDHGVPLTLRIEMELRDSLTLTLLAEDVQRFEIRYLPLSEHYELRGPGQEEVRNYPRLRHVLAALSSIRLDLVTGALAPGDYEFRIRTRLDNGRLPAPMRLPALFSARWHHDSEWSTWPFKTGI